MEQTLLQSIYRCDQCKKTFDIFDLPPQTYGEFIMYAKNGEMTYWDAFNDPVWKNTTELANRLPIFAIQPEIPRSSLFLKVCGICLDPASDGSIFHVWPGCPHCGSEDVTFLRQPDPSVIATFDVPNVTYNAWNKLDDEAKKRLILEEANRRISEIP